MTFDPNALNDREREQVKLARSMADSTIRNLLVGLSIEDLNAYQLRRLASVCLVASRRRDHEYPLTAALPSTGGRDER